jgi:hypothetical protein
VDLDLFRLDYHLYHNLRLSTCTYIANHLVYLVVTTSIIGIRIVTNVNGLSSIPLISSLFVTPSPSQSPVLVATKVTCPKFKLQALSGLYCLLMSLDYHLLLWLRHSLLLHHHHSLHYAKWLSYSITLDLYSIHMSSLVVDPCCLDRHHHLGLLLLVH